MSTVIIVFTTESILPQKKSVTHLVHAQVDIEISDIPICLIELFADICYIANLVLTNMGIIMPFSSTTI